MRLATKIYGEENRGREIVLVHGTGARAEMWRRQIDGLLAEGWCCIVPDLRGHGQSHEPGDTADIHAHLNDVLETLEHLNLPINYPVVFAGHSLGAIIGIELAHRRPRLIERVLAVSMPGKVPAITCQAFAWFLGWPYNAMRQSGLHRKLDWRTRELVATNKHALEQILHHFAAADYTRNLPEVSCPVHFAVGRLDPVAPWTAVQQMHEALPNSTLRIIEWAGHNPMDSQPQAFNDWFFSRLPGRTC